MLKEFYLDCETTGLDPKINGIWQIAGMIVVGNQVEPFSLMMRPFESDRITPEALEVSKMTEEEMRALPKPRTIYAKLIDLMGRHVDKFDKSEKFIFLGYNARFDSQFLREWFIKCGDKYFGSWFYTPPVDIMATAAFYLADRRHELENFKLGTVVKYLGLEIDRSGEFHDADIDVLYTYELAKYLRMHYLRIEK
jgi:DNA polymerase III subunit epsilon